jgi:RES domain-containing protein
VLYTSEHFGTAMLEKLVYFGRVGLPPLFNQYYIEGVIPAGCTYEVPDLQDPLMHRWADDPSSSPPWTVSQQYGEDWYLGQRSLCLIVPSLPASTIESNVVLNTNHPEFSKYVVWAGRSGQVHWDHRLFGVLIPPVRASSHVAGPPGTHGP